MESTNKYKKRFFILLFIVVLVNITTPRIYSQNEDIKAKIKNAESFYSLKLYQQAVTKLNRLKKQILEDTKMEGKEEILADIFFVCGACYSGLNRFDLAEDQYKKALKYNPDYEANEERYSGYTLELFLRIKNGENIEDITESALAKKIVQEKIYTGKFCVKVVKANAVLRLFPDKNSSIVKNIPVGALLDVEQIEREWIKVSLLPNKDGIIVTGYIHISFIEVEPKLYKKK